MDTSINISESNSDTRVSFYKISSMHLTGQICREKNNQLTSLTSQNKTHLHSHTGAPHSMLSPLVNPVDSSSASSIAGRRSQSSSSGGGVNLSNGCGKQRTHSNSEADHKEYPVLVVNLSHFLN